MSANESPAGSSSGLRSRTSDNAQAATWFDRHAGQLAAAFVLVFLISGIATLGDFGLTWDEGLGNHLFGERNLRFLTSLDPRYLDLDFDLAPRRQPDLALGRSAESQHPYSFPGFVDLPSDRHQVRVLLLARMAEPDRCLPPVSDPPGGRFPVGLVSVQRSSGGRGAGAAGDRDAGSGASLLGRHALQRQGRPRDDLLRRHADGLLELARSAEAKEEALIAGLLMGCALAAKPNALFVLPILLVSIMPWRPDRREWLALAQRFRERWLHYAIMAACVAGFYFLSWPYLYANPLLGLKTYWGGIVKIGNGRLCRMADRSPAAGSHDHAGGDAAIPGDRAGGGRLAGGEEK